MLKKLMIPAVILAVSMTVAVWMVMQQPAPAEKLADAPVLLVDVVEVEPADLRLKVEAQGTVTPRTQTTLVSEVAGQIREVSNEFVAGGFFERGDVLVRIDDRNYRAEVKRAQAAVAAARTQIKQEKGLADYARSDWERLNPDKPATDLALRKPQLEEAEANLQSALAELERREGDLDRTVIRAPYDGMIREKLADIGQFVSAGSQLARVFSSDAVEIRLPLPGRELPYVDLDASPAVNVTATIGDHVYAWEGTIVRTEGVFDEQSRVLHAVARVEDPYNQSGERWEYPLRVGTFVEASIDGIHVSDVVRLPRSALRRGNQVWTIAEGDKLAPRTVSVLRNDKDTVFIDDGLNAGDLVCLTTLENPLPGTVVRYEEPSS